MASTLTFRMDKNPEILPLFVDCLLALSNLRTLEIMPTHLPLVTLFDKAFEHRPQWQSVRRFIAPSGAHPMVQCFPNLEEIACNGGQAPHILLEKAYADAGASLKRFDLVGRDWTDKVGQGKLRLWLVDQSLMVPSPAVVHWFPNIQKLAMRKVRQIHGSGAASVAHLSPSALGESVGTTELVDRDF